MNFVIPGVFYELSSATRKSRTVLLRLQEILPKPKLDVRSMAFTEDPPEGLKSMSIIIGGQTVATVPRSDLQKGADVLLRDLCGHGIKTSKCKYMQVDAELEFDQQYLAEREHYAMVPEMRDVVTYADDEEEFYDGVDHMHGRRVYRSTEPTGRQVREVTEGVVVKIPAILCTLSEPEKVDGAEADVLLPVWQTLSVHGGEYEYVDRLRRLHNLELADDRFSDLDAAIDSKAPFTARVQNTIRYHGHMAGLCCFF